MLLSFFAIKPAQAATIHPQYSIPPAPAYSRSWYANNPDPQDNFQRYYNEGYLDGAYDNQYCNFTITILYFGQPEYLIPTYGGGNPTYGLDDWQTPQYFLSFSQIDTAMERYAWGWYNANSCSTLMLGMGTNNSNECGGLNSSPISCLQNAGDAFSAAVSTLQRYLTQNGLGSQITAVAADDIETQYDPAHNDTWDTYTNTKYFLDAYNLYTTISLYDFGDAFTNISRGWNYPALYEVSYGEKDDYSIPETYNGNPSAELQLWQQYPYILLSGLMTDCSSNLPGCANSGWSSALTTLYNNGSNGYSGTPAWLTNIQWTSSI